MKRSSGIALHCEPHIASEIGVDEIYELAARLSPPTRAVLKRHSMFADKTAMQEARVLDARRPLHMEAQQGQNTTRDGRDMSYDADLPPMYDGFELCKIASEEIADHARDDPGAACMLDVIFTDILVATFDHEDRRYHARTMVGANPFVISIPGIVEAPAKPREYYVRLLVAGMTSDMPSPPPSDPSPPHRGATASQGAHTGTKLDYMTRNDPRLRDAAVGLLLQAVSYHETGEAFCEDKSCRIYNAHWQSDLIRTQVTEPKLCNKHQKILGLAIDGS